MFPAACARSQPTTAPASWPAAVSRSMSNAWPVAKLTPLEEDEGEVVRRESAMAVSRSSIRTRCSPSRGPTTTRSVAGSSPRWARWLVRAWRSDGKSGPSARIRLRRPLGRKNEASSRWMLTVRLLSRATSTGRAPTMRAIDSRRDASRVNHGRAGSNQASTPWRAQRLQLCRDRRRGGPRLEPERLTRQVDRRRAIGRRRDVEPVAGRRRQRLGRVACRRVLVGHGPVSGVGRSRERRVAFGDA